MWDGEGVLFIWAYKTACLAANCGLFAQLYSSGIALEHTAERQKLFNILLCFYICIYADASSRAV